MCSGKQKLSGCITVVTVNLIIWGAIVSFIIVYHIPTDTRSSSENDVHNTSAAENETQLLTTNGSNDTAPGQLLCSDDFYLDDERNVCFPECGEWAVYPKELGVAMNTLVILSVIIGIIGGTMVILLSCFNSQKTFTFPSSLVRYQTASVMMYDVILLIGRTAPTKLFCNSRNLIESLQDPALFCSIMGVIIQYAYWLTTIWWFTHITAFCWVVRYPFLAHKFETSGKKKYLHFAAVLLGVVLPWISIGLILGAGGYTFASVPPIVCVPNSVNASFYFFIMPIIILQAAGTSLLTIIFWTIHKERQAMAKETDTKKVENKILIVLCYFVVFGIFTFVIIALRFWRNARPEEEFNAYFICESLGTSVEIICDRSAINRSIPDQILFDILQMFYGSFPAVNLLYAINFREAREKWGQCHVHLPPR